MTTDGGSRIGEDPFLTPRGDRDPATRLRGRLAAPVTIWTSYDPSGDPIGVTISSVIVVEGVEPCVFGALQPLSDFWEAASAAGRFVLHVAPAGAERLADGFAGRYPGPELPFPADTTRSDFGPVLTSLATRAYCSVRETIATGGALVVRAAIEGLDLDEREMSPLVHFRGRYLAFGPRP